MYTLGYYVEDLDEFDYSELFRDGYMLIATFFVFEKFGLTKFIGNRFRIAAKSLYESFTDADDEDELSRKKRRA